MKGRTLGKRAELAAGRVAIAALAKLSGKLNRERIGRWGTRLGDLAYFGSCRYRRVALANLAQAFPDWSQRDVRRTARETFRNFARGLLEFFYLQRVSPEELDEWIMIEGAEHVDAALAKGQGIICVTAHLGNWEILARKLARQGYRLSVIARDSDDPETTRIINHVRENGGYKVLGRDSSALAALRCLRKNELLGILPDQNTLSGVFVEFFDRPVAAVTGPAVLALKTGAAIMCGFARRTPEGRFKAVVYPPLDLPHTGSEEGDVHALTAAFTRVIEAEIRKDPAQWLWLHDRWRRTAEAPGGSTVPETSS